MTGLKDLWKQHQKLMDEIDSVASVKFKLEKRLCEVTSKINKIKNDQRHAKFRVYLKKHPLRCKHEPLKLLRCNCEELPCCGHSINCKLCGAKKLEQILENVWATKEECVAIWQGALGKK